MSCKSMSHYQSLVAGMSDDERTSAAQAGFDAVNNLEERDDVVLGLCAATTLYGVDISTMAETRRLAGLSEAMDKANAMNQTEQFNTGLKSFFAVNYAPEEERDAIFTGYYASAALSDVNLEEVSALAPDPGPSVGPVKSVW